MSEEVKVRVVNTGFMGTVNFIGWLYTLGVVMADNPDAFQAWMDSQGGFALAIKVIISFVLWPAILGATTRVGNAFDAVVMVLGSG